MLDSLEDARQLCAMHGYETGVVQGVPAVLLVKVRACNWVQCTCTPLPCLHACMSSEWPLLC